MDKFANIAAGYKTDNSRGLITPEPEKITGKVLELDTSAEGFFEPIPKISTRDELYKELKKQKATVKETWLLTVDKAGKVFFCRKEEK